MADVDWVRRFAAAGYSEPARLAGGMEGTVYQLSTDLVAKVWHSRAVADVALLAAFHRELRSNRLPFATPDIVDVLIMDDRVVSVERRLAGVPLAAALRDGQVSTSAARQCVLTVLSVLGQTAAGPASARLTAMGGSQPLRASGKAWPAALADLLSQRIDRYGHQLRPVVDRFDDKVIRLAELLATLPPNPGWVVHGDLCRPNILVDDAGDVVGLLDWGFLTTRGDAALDAATCPGFFDMYGPDARRHDDELTDLISKRLDYDGETLLLYRAWYAVIASNAYDPSGRDGHFAWCVAQLNRADIAELLR